MRFISFLQGDREVRGFLLDQRLVKQLTQSNQYAIVGCLGADLSWALKEPLMLMVGIIMAHRDVHV